MQQAWRLSVCEACFRFCLDDVYSAFLVGIGIFWFVSRSYA
jgi:hypothetical protein